MASLQQKRKKEPEEEVQDTNSVPDNNTSSHHAHKTRRNYSKLLKTLRNGTSASHEHQHKVKTEPDKEQQEKTKSVSDKGTSKADASELPSPNKNGLSAAYGKHKVRRPVKRKEQEVVTVQEEINSSPDSSGGYVLKLELSMADKNATEAPESQPDPQDQVNLLFHVTMTEGENSNQPVNIEEEENPDSDSEDGTNSSTTSEEEASMSTSEEEKDESGKMSVDSDLRVAEGGDERLYRYVYSSGRKVIRGLNTRYTELNDLLYMQREICGENSGPPHTTTPNKDGQGGRSKGISHKDGQQGRSTSKGVSSGVAGRTGERTGSKTKKMSSTVARLLPEKAADSGTEKGEESCPKTLVETVLEQTGLNMEDFVEEQYNPLIPHNPVLERRSRQYNCKHCAEYSYTLAGIISHITLQHRALLVQKLAQHKDRANVTAGKSGMKDGKQGRLRYKCSLCKRSRNIKSFFAMRAHLRDKHHVSQHFERCCTVVDDSTNSGVDVQQPTEYTGSSETQPLETTERQHAHVQQPTSPSGVPSLETAKVVDAQQPTDNPRSSSDVPPLTTNSEVDVQQPIDDTSPSETQPLETMNRYDAQQPTDNTRPSDLPPLEATDSRVDAQQPTSISTDSISPSEITPLERTNGGVDEQQTPGNMRPSEIPRLETTNTVDTHVHQPTGNTKTITPQGSAVVENQLKVCVKTEPPDKMEEIPDSSSLQFIGVLNGASATLMPPTKSMDTIRQERNVMEYPKACIKTEPPDTWEQIHWNTNLHTDTSNGSSTTFMPPTTETSIDTLPEENAVTENQLKVSVKTEPPDDTMEQIPWNASLQTGTSQKAYVKTEPPETVEHFPDNTSLQLQTDASNGAASTALMPPETMPQERTVMEYQKACVKTEPPDTWEHVPENMSLQLRKDSSNAGIQKYCVKTEPPDSNKVGTALIPPKKSKDSTTPAKHQVVMKFFCNLCQADIGSTLHSDITSHLQSHQITALTGSSFLRAQIICENVCGRPGTVGTREQTPDSVTLQTSTSDVPPRVSSIPTTLHHISDAERASEQTPHNTSEPPNMRQFFTTHAKPAATQHLISKQLTPVPLPPVREYLSYIPSAPQCISDRERTVTVNPPQASGAGPVHVGRPADTCSQSKEQVEQNSTTHPRPAQASRVEPIHVGRPANTCSQSKEHMKQNSTTHARPAAIQKLSKQVTPVPMPAAREPLTYSTGEERAVSVNPLQASGAQPVHIQSRQLYTCCLCKEHVNIKGYAAMKFHLQWKHQVTESVEPFFFTRKWCQLAAAGPKSDQERDRSATTGQKCLLELERESSSAITGQKCLLELERESSSATTGQKRLLELEREGRSATTGQKRLLEPKRDLGSSETTGKKRRVEREEFCNKANRKRLSSYFPALAANTTSNSKAPETRQETRQPTCTPVSNSQSSHTDQDTQEVQPMAPVEGDVTVSTSSSTWVPPVDAGTRSAPLLSRLPSRMTADLRSSYQVYECSICSSQYRYFSSILEHAQRQHHVSVMGSFTKYIRKNVVTVGKPAHQFAGYPQKAASTPAQTQESTGPGTTSSFPGYTKKSASDSKSAATISELLKKSAVTGVGKMANQFAGYPQKAASTPAQTQKSTVQGTASSFPGYIQKPAYDRSATTISGPLKKSAVTGAEKTAHQFAGYPQKGASTPAQTQKSTAAGLETTATFSGYTPKPAYDRSATTIAGLSKKTVVTGAGTCLFAARDQQNGASTESVGLQKGASIGYAATSAGYLQKGAVTGTGESSACQFSGYQPKGASTGTAAGLPHQKGVQSSTSKENGCLQSLNVTTKPTVKYKPGKNPRYIISDINDIISSVTSSQTVIPKGHQSQTSVSNSDRSTSSKPTQHRLSQSLVRKESSKRKESPKRESSPKKKQIALDDNPKPTVVKSEESNRHKKNSSNTVKTEQKDQCITQLAPNSDFGRSEESNRHKKSTEPSSNTVKTEPKDQNITNAQNPDFSSLDVTQLKEEGLRFKCASPCNNVWNSWEELTTYCHSYQPSAAGQDQITLQMSWETVQTFFAPSEQGYECSFCYECLQEDLAGHLSSHTVPRVEVKIIKLSTA